MVVSCNTNFDTLLALPIALLFDLRPASASFCHRVAILFSFLFFPFHFAWLDIDPAIDPPPHCHSLYVCKMECGNRKGNGSKFFCWYDAYGAFAPKCIVSLAKIAGILVPGADNAMQWRCLVTIPSFLSMMKYYMDLV
jgi:hypothetical protein